MGVKICNRRDCDNTMCNTYIKNIGYICSDCVTEFKNISDESFPNGPYTENELLSDLKKFMNTSPIDNTKEITITVNDFFEKYTDK